MNGPWFGHNLALRPVAEAVVGLDDINFAYGYGVYETLKVRHGLLYFPELHAERLLHSAVAIDLVHDFRQEAVIAHFQDLVAANGRPDSNIKVLLIGRSGGGADLYVLELNPLFPKRQDYRNGAKAVSFDGERVYPQAKTLNMLVSTLAYRKAQAAGAYDALLVDRQGFVREGTRTNLFYTDGTKIWSPPVDSVLDGVTRRTVVQCMAEHGQEVHERPLHRDEAHSWSLFLTSTSTKIMPLASLDGKDLPQATAIHDLMAWYDAWLEAWATSARSARNNGDCHRPQG